MTCSKTAFSKAVAHRELRRLSYKGKRMRAYVCEKCFKYHLTSKVHSPRAYKAQSWRI